MSPVRERLDRRNTEEDPEVIRVTRMTVDFSIRPPPPFSLLRYKRDRTSGPWLRRTKDQCQNDEEQRLWDSVREDPGVKGLDSYFY